MAANNDILRLGRVERDRRRAPAKISLRWHTLAQRSGEQSCGLAVAIPAARLPAASHLAAAKPAIFHAGGGARGTIAAAQPQWKFPAGRPLPAWSNAARRATSTPGAGPEATARWLWPATGPFRGARSALPDPVLPKLCRWRAFLRSVLCARPVTRF